MSTFKVYMEIHTNMIDRIKSKHLLNEFWKHLLNITLYKPSYSYFLHSFEYNIIIIKYCSYIYIVYSIVSIPFYNFIHNVYSNYNYTHTVLYI